ncbi:MAG: HAD family hydrolase [Leptospiraceae bacterium]|nr:HAD family hydrolase [Leptospiraceae bacterium]MCP5494722.1 HAD family hydrolase [Leptospiraceae bacterium]
MNIISEFHTIATDLDGTLLNQDAILTDFTKKVLQKAIDSKIQLIIATGRRFASVLNYSKQFQGTVQVASSNGQILRLSPCEKRVREHYLPEFLVRTVVQKGKNFGLSPLLHVDEYEEGIDMVTEIPLKHPNFMNYANGKKDRSIQLDNCLDYNLNKVTIVCWLNHDKQRLKEFDKLLKAEIGTKCSQNVITTIPRVGPCMDVIQKDISKWSAIQEFLKINGKSEKGVIAFGDEANDMEMIKNAGFGVALKNATDELKSVAKCVSNYSNQEDGVAKTLVELGIVTCT